MSAFFRGTQDGQWHLKVYKKPVRVKGLVVGRGRGARGLFRNKVTYFFLNDPPSTLLSRYLSNSASLFTASGDTFGAFGKQINITLMLSRLPWWKRKNDLRNVDTPG